jgi:hypothetical protein
MPRLKGVPHALQRALVNLLALVLTLPDVDYEIGRRAQWLKWGLEGYDPLQRREYERTARRHGASRA